MTQRRLNLGALKAFKCFECGFYYAVIARLDEVKAWQYIIASGLPHFATLVRNDEFGCEFLAVRHSELVLDKRRIHNRKICVNLKCDFEFKCGLFCGFFASFAGSE